MHTSSRLGSPQPPPPPPPQLLIGGQAAFCSQVVLGQSSVQLSHHASNSSRCSSSVIENSSSSPSWFSSFSVMTSSSPRRELHSMPLRSECWVKRSALHEWSNRATYAGLRYSAPVSYEATISLSKNPSCPQDSARTNQI